MLNTFPHEFGSSYITSTSKSSKRFYSKIIFSESVRADIILVLTLCILLCFTVRSVRIINNNSRTSKTHHTCNIFSASFLAFVHEYRPIPPRFVSIIMQSLLSVRLYTNVSLLEACPFPGIVIWAAYGHAGTLLCVFGWMRVMCLNFAFKFIHK